MYDTNDFPASAELVADVIDETRRTGDRRTEARAVGLHALVLTSMDPTVTTQAALERATEAMRTLEELGDEVGAVRAMAIVSFFTFALGDVDGALAISWAHLDRAKRTGQLAEIRIALQGLADELYYGSTPADDALEEIERLVSMVADSPAATANVVRHQASLYAMLGRFDEARAAAERNVALLEQVGTSVLLASRGFWIGPMHMLAGEYQEAERVIRRSVDSLTALGEKGFNSTLSAELAEALLAQGRIDEAEQYAEQARTLGAEDDITT
jgi:tetratricopeptide (TPR) repeat protein